MIISLTDSTHPRVDLGVGVLVIHVYEQVGRPLVRSGGLVRAIISFVLFDSKYAFFLKGYREGNGLILIWRPGTETQAKHRPPHHHPHHHQKAPEPPTSIIQQCHVDMETFSMSCLRGLAGRAESKTLPLNQPAPEPPGQPSSEVKLLPWQ